MSEYNKIGDKLRKYVKRVLDEANYIINTKKTIRETAAKFNLSKSTIHNDLKNRLTAINQELYQKIQPIMVEHQKYKHIRGGEANKNNHQNK